MKKTLALLAMALMLISTGCGKDKPAEEVQQNTTSTVEEVKEKVDDATQAATDAANNAVNTVQSMIEDAKTVMASIQSGTVDKKVPALDGVVPGINYEIMTEKYGEPISYENQIAQFSNGLDMKVVNNVVEEVSTMYDGLYTPADVAVGMGDSILNDVYGDAASVVTGDNGVTYKYVSGDKKRTIEFVTRDGYISEIKCSVNK